MRSLLESSVSDDKPGHSWRSSFRQLSTDFPHRLLGIYVGNGGRTFRLSTASAMVCYFNSSRFYI